MCPPHSLGLVCPLALTSCSAYCTHFGGKCSIFGVQTWADRAWMSPVPWLVIFFQGLPGGNWVSQPVHAGVWTLQGELEWESQEARQQINAFPLLSWEELSRAEWLHTAVPKLLAVLPCEAVAHSRMYHWVWVFPPPLFHFSFSFTFATRALHPVLECVASAFVPGLALQLLAEQVR